MAKRRSIGDKIFDTANIILMLIILVAVLYPFFNSVAISLNDANDTTRGGLTIFPRVFTLRNYQLIFTNAKIYTAYLVTIGRTVIGTVSALFFTSLLAYGLAHTNLKGRTFYIILCIIPMYFSGGLIPSYFLIRSMKLINSFWVYIIPGLVGIWNMLLMKTYFQGIPISLEESARIDGANYLKIFFKIILPISTPIIATIALFIGVGQWNSWFDSYIYITKQNLKPMQSVLLSIISEAKFAESLAQSASTAGGAINASNIGKTAKVNVRSISMATMFVTILPIIMVYPFLQRYFVKGIMIGSIKG
jgi:putative aldouronate transport system permease protein